MGLSVYLEDAAGEELFSSNITHNVTPMASAAGVYSGLWRPEEHGVTAADQLIAPLAAGVALLQEQPARFDALSPSNGWGTREDFLRFCRECLAACQQHPQARVAVCR